MPTVLRIGPFRFHFYSDERDEPAHIHVAVEDAECKFWLDPVRLARNKGVPTRLLPKIEDLIYKHLTLLKEKCREIHKS